MWRLGSSRVPCCRRADRRGAARTTRQRSMPAPTRSRGLRLVSGPADCEPEVAVAWATRARRRSWPAWRPGPPGARAGPSIRCGARRPAQRRARRRLRRTWCAGRVAQRSSFIAPGAVRPGRRTARPRRRVLRGRALARGGSGLTPSGPGWARRRRFGSIATRATCSADRDGCNLADAADRLLAIRIGPRRLARRPTPDLQATTADLVDGSWRGRRPFDNP
jgi:hypothetical protein